jgi:thiol-disulfide isomerase/thioredoxin
MKTLISMLFAVLLLTKVSAQQPVALKAAPPALKKMQPFAAKKFSVIYDASSTSLAAAKEVSGIAVFYPYQKKPVTQPFQLKKQQGLWSAIINIPDSIVLVRFVFEDKQQGQNDGNNGKGYLLPVYKQNKPVQFAYAQMASLSSDGPPDAYGLKRDHKLALAFMKKELEYHPESEALLKQRFYNMLANSPEREDKVDLVKRLTAMKSDQETDLMMAQLYLSFFGSKQQADSLDRLLMAKFPNGNYVQQKKLKADGANKPAETEATTKTDPIEKAAIDPAELIKELTASRLNEPVAALTLKDMDGNDVVLGGTALKGKVMVIDFWATWCKPCIKSFPAMQQVMDKYKGNADVKFFYICTMERGDPLSNVKEFLSKNPLPFKILMDEKTTDMNMYKAFTHYKVDGGIPYKLVIDGDGNVRFRTVGFSGDDELLVKELSAMIDLTLK